MQLENTPGGGHPSTNRVVWRPVVYRVSCPTGWWRPDLIYWGLGGLNCYRSSNHDRL